MTEAIIRTGIFDSADEEIELTSESGVHVHQAYREPHKHLFDGTVRETMLARDGKTTMVLIEPDERHRHCGFTGGLWISAKRIRFANGGGWIAELRDE